MHSLKNEYKRLKWLPGRDTQRTIHKLILHIPIHLIYNGSNALDILEGKAPYGISSTDRITKAILRRHKPVICKPNPIAIALKYQQLYEQTGSMTIVGQQFDVSRVRIHQMLNLLKLDQKIIDYIQIIKDARQSNYWSEHRLRSIARLPQEQQYNKFQKLIAK